MQNAELLVYFNSDIDFLIVSIGLRLWKLGWRWLCSAIHVDDLLHSYYALGDSRSDWRCEGVSVIDILCILRSGCVCLIHSEWRKTFVFKKLIHRVEGVFV